MMKILFTFLTLLSLPACTVDKELRNQVIYKCNGTAGYTVVYKNELGNQVTEIVKTVNFEHEFQKRDNMNSLFISATPAAPNELINVEIYYEGERVDRTSSDKEGEEARAEYIIP